jgi:hypothetical protein
MKSNRLHMHNPKGIAVEWLAGCKSDEERQKKIENLQNNSLLFDQLKKMIQQRYDSAISTNDTDYDNVSWSHKQAHRNGKLEVLEDIYKLLP